LQKEFANVKAFGCLLMLVVPLVAQAGPPVPAELLPELRKGGYILFMRHPKTNADQADTDPLNLENVKAQRQLTDEGREQARGVGAAFRTLNIPVENITSSKFYRAQEASKLLDLGPVTTSVDVTEGGQVVSPRENQRRAKALQQLLSEAPAKGKNRIIVSHRPNLQDAAGKDLGDLGEGEIVVFQPLGEGKFKVVARVAPPEVWSQWAK
jgi:phosphohistidine phosphatase SixA